MVVATGVAVNSIKEVSAVKEIQQGVPFALFPSY
jgi:hypothetical protein